MTEIKCLLESIQEIYDSGRASVRVVGFKAELCVKKMMLK